mgnify:CR=1 FL=1
MTTRAITIGLGGTAMLLAGVGCNTVPQTEYDAAIAENNELRERREELAQRLTQSEADKQALQQNNRELAGELQRLEAELASQPDQPQTPSGFVTRPGEDAVVTLGSDVLFRSGSATLTSDGKRRLNEIAGTIRSRYPGMRVRVEGYTDSDPIQKSDWGTNIRLSAERAMAVENYLVERGLPDDLVYSAAMGSSDLKPTKAASRRVEIVVLSGGG